MANHGEARRVMVEGESGLLAIASSRARPRFETSQRLLVWPHGARAAFYFAAEPESLRGPQHSHTSGHVQKELFVNEALAGLDALVQPTVQDEPPLPPTEPQAGDASQAPSTAQGHWLGEDGAFAVHQGTH